MILSRKRLCPGSVIFQFNLKISFEIGIVLLFYFLMILNLKRKKKTTKTTSKDGKINNSNRKSQKIFSVIGFSSFPYFSTSSLSLYRSLAIIIVCWSSKTTADKTHHLYINPIPSIKCQNGLWVAQKKLTNMMREIKHDRWVFMYVYRVFVYQS